MVKQDWMVVVAGKKLVDALTAERNELKAKLGDKFNDEILCGHQKAIARRGVVGAEIVTTIYGFSLRYDSGLQGFGIIQRRLATMREAVERAREWVAYDPANRYAWRRKTNEERA